MSNLLTIYRRELVAFFSRPTAYAIVVVFLLLAMGLTFSFGQFMRLRDASLEYTFFSWHPFIYMLLAPAVAMGLWADEQRNGTIELLGTMPTSIWSAILGKFMAASTVWLVALGLTFPIWMTVNVLGDPDNLTIISGYLGSLMTCCAFTALTLLVSAFTRDQVVALIVSVVLCVFIVVIGHDSVILPLSQSVGETVTDRILTIGVYDHFRSLARGAFRLQDFFWYVSVTAACLAGTNAILSARRS